MGVSLIGKKNGVISMQKIVLKNGRFIDPRDDIMKKIDARFEEKKLSNRIERDLLVEQLSLVREEWDTV